MIKLFNKPLLACMCLLMCVAFFTACKKDDNNTTSQIQLLSFGPTGARHGDTLRFIGTNLDKVTEIDFTGSGAVVAQSAFLQQNYELILLLVPKQAEQGFVTLKTPQGDIVTKTKLNLNVATTVSSMTPQARPGENITIKGEYLNWVTRITFAKDKNVDTFVSKSLNEIVVKVPMDAQTGPLVLSFGGTEPLTVETADTFKVTLPVITGMAPNPVKHAANVTITGTNLDLAKQVLFTSVSAPVTTFVSQSATQLVVKVPASTTKGKITLIAASGVSTQSTADLDVVLPSITKINPSPVDPLANVTITGTNLDIVSAITFNNAAPVTTFVSQTATQIVVKVPSGVASGKVTFGVLNSTLTVQSNDPLEILGDVPPPTIAFPFYKDALSGNWNGWLGGGWGGTKDMDNTNPVREGTKSIRISYEGGYGSPLQLGGANVTIAPYTTFKISIFGAPGSAGKKINIGINGADKYEIIVVEGKWTDYSVPISALTSAANITEILVKEYNGSGGFTIYVDALGLN